MQVRHTSRRELLLASGALATLVGCIGSDNGDDDPGDDSDDGMDDEADDDTGDDTDDEPGDDPDDEDLDDEDPGDEDPGDEPETAAEQIESARRSIQSAYDELGKRDEETFDNEVFEGHLSDAESSLDDGSDLATDEEATTIADLRDVIEYLEPLGKAEVLAEGGFENLGPGIEAYWKAREPYWDDDHDADEYVISAETFIEAAESFEAAESAFDDIWPLYEGAQSRLEEIDPGVVDAFEGVDHEAQVEDIEARHYLTANMLQFVTGHHLGSVGWAHTSIGIAEALNEQWESARSELEPALDLFDNAGGRYIFVDFEFMYGAVPVLEDWFGEIHCEISHGEVMVNHFIDAVDAAMDGDMDTYEAEAEAGFEATADCHE